MKKNGFTLIEVLAVVVFLALVVGVAMPNIMLTFERLGDTRYDEFVRTVELSAETYINQNSENYTFSTPNDIVIITFNDLVTAGLFSSDAINPQTEQIINLNEEIKIELSEDYTKIVTYPYLGE